MANTLALILLASVPLTSCATCAPATDGSVPKSCMERADTSELLMVKAKVRADADADADAALDGKSTAAELENQKFTEDHLLQESMEVQKTAMAGPPSWGAGYTNDEFIEYSGKDCGGSNIEKHTTNNGGFIFAFTCQDFCYGARDRGCAGVSYKVTDRARSKSECFLKFHNCTESEATDNGWTFFALKGEYLNMTHYTSKFTTCPNGACGDCPGNNIESHSQSSDYKCLRYCWDKRGSPWHCKGISIKGNSCILKRATCSNSQRSYNGWRFYSLI